MTTIQELLKNWKVVLLIAFVVLSLFSIVFFGISLGVDFKGGTLFQIHLAEKASQEQLNTIRQTIQQRLDWTGLKDTSVNVWGDEFIVAQIAETNPEKVARLEELLKRQGKFEVTLKGEVLFTGSDIIHIVKDPSKGYGIIERPDGSVMWFLPFVLKENAAKNFSQKVFHKCTIISYDPKSGKQYECEATYFFIDRPTNSVIIIPQTFYDQDKLLLERGNYVENIPQNTDIKELLENMNVPYIIVDKNFTAEQFATLEQLAKNNKYAIVPPTLEPELKQQLISMGYKLREEAPFSELYNSMLNSPLLNPADYQKVIPWIWQVSGAKQIIMLSEDITGMDPYIADIKDAKIYSELQIRGYGIDKKDAKRRLDDLAILLESGSLPVAVESISRETISPYLGEEFLKNAALMGFCAIVLVAAIILVRYKKMKLSIPIIVTGMSEVIIILGFASLIHWRLDLAAVAGIVAAVGTGVDHQIIIMDELIHGIEEKSVSSVIARIKRAFFIIVAAVSTVIAAMLPLLLFGFGMGKLVGFAITTISGAIIGVVITRPAFAEMAKYCLQK